MLTLLEKARFLTSAPRLSACPPNIGYEVAFAGRSNAGKSTAINTLAQQRQLAYASKKPGRTQHINLFSLGKQGIMDAVLTDLPGYGYAAVPKADKLRWQRVMANYLVTRENLKAIVLLCDPRHGITELDEILLEVIRPRIEEGLKFLVLLTKADKLNRTDGAKALQIAIDGETYEYTEMYPTFRKTAEAEGNAAAVAEMDEQIEESKVHAAQFTATLVKAQKRFAALAKVEERHANHYQKALDAIQA